MSKGKQQILIYMKNSTENLYQLDGRVPIGKALPFGLQHVLAMFVSNITPIMILAGAVGLDSALSATLIQNCMVIAGIGTLVQLFPIWRVGSRLPIVMGISFTFLSLAIGIAGTYGMGTLVGAVIVGGIVEGILGAILVLVIVLAIRNRAKVSKVAGEYESEVKRVTWLSWAETKRSTIVVLIALIVCALVICLLDFGLSEGINAIIRLFQ